MSLISFMPEASFNLLERVFKVSGLRRIQREGGEDQTELDLVDSEGAVSTKSLEFLLDQYQKGTLRPVHEHFQTPVQRLLGTRKVYPLAADVAPDKLEIGEKCKSLLHAVHKAGGLARGRTRFWKNEYPALCKKMGFIQPPCKTTIMRWLKKVGKAGDIPWAVVLAPETHLRGGKGGIRANSTAVSLMHQCVEDYFFGAPGATVSSCHRDMLRQFAEYNRHLEPADRLSTPGYKQLRTYIASLPAYDVEAARFGKTAANEKFVSVQYRRHKLRPLQRVEVDHTPLDIYAVDDDGVFLGRVRLTLVVDCCTRAILGYSIGFDGASASAVLEALRHACTPKTYIADRFPEVSNRWPMHGRFELLAMDNGPEFHSDKRFKASVLEFSMASEFAWMPRKLGRYKALVEQVQKYLNRSAIDSQPGASGSHPHTRARSEVPPEEYAVHKLSSLHKLLHLWICDVYNVTPHGKDSIVPIKRWNELTSVMPVRLPAHFDRLELACGVIDRRKIQHYGLDICDLNTFNNHALQEVRRLYQHKETFQVQVLYKPAKLDRIWFKHPATKDWIPVENHDPETRDKSQYQVQAMRRIQREAANSQELQISVALAFQKMREIGSELLKAKTITQRKRGLMLLGLLPSVAADMANPVRRRARGAEPVSAPKPATRKASPIASRQTPALGAAPPDFVGAQPWQQPANEPPVAPVWALPKPLPVIGR